ncbi:MAG: hypothetical protein L6Q98_13000 [Anaerolineae bacterium]|nr:hypothetical protein [Anaerolineae bacterium]NUQ03291.1 hypothetical protein [Anaerolineae bacterium]
MRLDLYTEKSIAESLSALNARLQAKGSSRSNLEGWIEKSGTFAVSITTPVAGKFSRRTTLHGKLERRDGHTVVHIDVPSGANRQGIVLMIGAVALISIALMASSNVMLALALLPIAAYLYIPMRGDHDNSAALISDVQRTLKARNTPPKRQTSEKESVRARAKS